MDFNVRMLWSLTGDKQFQEQSWNQALLSYWNGITHEELEVRMTDFDYYELCQFKNNEEFLNFLYNDFYQWIFTDGRILANNRKRLVEGTKAKPLQSYANVHEKLCRFKRTSIKEGLSIASSIAGMGYTSASGLLALIHPQYFATINSSVIKALYEVRDLYPADMRMMISDMISDKGEPVLNENNTVLAIQLLQKKAKELNNMFLVPEWTPRKIEKVLWQFE